MEEDVDEEEGGVVVLSWEEEEEEEVVSSGVEGLGVDGFAVVELVWGVVGKRELWFVLQAEITTSVNRVTGIRMLFFFMSLSLSQKGAPSGVPFSSVKLGG